VDDDPQVRGALARVIESQGLACLQAGSGAAALEVLKSEGEVPVCISDIYMPEMDGVTFLREALKLYPDMAVIMLTGVAEVSTAVECLQLGALDYISKPVLIDEVRARLQKALEKRELILQNRFYQQHLESRVRELDRRNKQSLINGVQTLVHALEAKTKVAGSARFVYTQQVVFVQDGKHIVTLHVDTEDSADYTALRNRLVPLIQQRLRGAGALHV